MNDPVNKENEYAFKNFLKKEDGTADFQKVAFVKLNEDGTYEDGTTLEEILRVCKNRLTHVNNKFSCRENSLAITKIEEAIMWLEARTKDRIDRGVDGQHKI